MLGVFVFCLLALLGFFCIEFFDVDGVGFVVIFYVIWVGVFVVLDFFGWVVFFKEE